MKVLLLSHSDIDGGAARATYRLHQGLQKTGIRSHMLVQEKSSDDPTVIGSKTSAGIGQAVNGIRLTLEKLPLKLYPNRTSATYSPQWLPNQVTRTITQLNPDIVNLHWVNNGYLQIESLKTIRQPIVLTLHDMWAFTGGCHYNQDCDRYTTQCGQCPQLQSRHTHDLSRWIWNRKATAWKDTPLTIVTPSHWLAHCAKASTLFRNLRIEVIPNGLDIDRYKPMNRTLAREILGLPQDKKLILSGSLKATSDKRKGFHLLQPALQDLSQSSLQDQIELVIFGASQPENPPDMGFKVHYLGTLSDDVSLALLYTAADVFVAPSVQDNLPNTVMEALACGTPCVAFNIGGMPDMIEHQKNGYLARPYEITDFSQGIHWVLEHQALHQLLSNRAREKVEQEFSLHHQAKRHTTLFAKLLHSS